MNYKYLVYLTLSLLIIGCESGNTKSKSSSSNAVTATSSSSQVSIEDPKEGIHNTKDLVADPHFDFSNQGELNVELERLADTNSRVAINICYTDEQGSIQQDNCLLNARTSQTDIHYSLTIGNEIEQLAMQIIEFETPVIIQTLYWNRKESPTHWTIRL